MRRHHVILIIVLFVAAQARVGSTTSFQENRAPVTTPGGCTFEGAVGGSAFEFTFNRPGAAIRDDGRGPYTNGIDSVVASLANAGARVYPYFPSAGQQRRTLVVDLSRPVQPDTQKNFGAIDRADSNFRVHWRVVDKRISSILEVPIGARVRSDRVEVSVILDGRQHILRFGNLQTGLCFPAAKLDGPDTTEATIHRVSESEWHVDLPRGSVGRLWDLNGVRTETTDLFKLSVNDRRENARDLGLYYADTSVIVRLQKK